LNAAANNNSTLSPSTQSGSTVLGQGVNGAYQNASQVFGQLGTDALQMIPGAQNFVNAELGPGLTPANQAYLNYSSQLGLQGLQQTENQIAGMYDNAPYSSALVPSELQAANQYASQMGQTGAGLAESQQQIGAGLASLPYSLASTSATSLPTTVSSLFNQTSQNQLGPAIADALQAYSTAPASGSAVVSGGKKG
jgi:hypothetical protein